MSILYPLLTLCSSSVTAYGVCYPESGPNNAFQSHHHPNTHLGAVATPQLTSPRSSTILTTGSAVLQHRGSTACHKNQYATSVPSKRCWLPGGPRQQERSFPASAHPAPLRLSRCPRVGCGVWASHYTTVTLSYHISQRKRFNKSQPVWKNDTQIKQALLPAAIWGWWWWFFFLI